MWEYTSEVKKSTGYEDVLPILKSYTSEMYKAADDEGKQKMIDEVFEIYRSRNIYPIVYYNKEGIMDEIRKCVEKDVLITGDYVDFKFNQGLSLCRYMMPGLQKVGIKGQKDNSLHDRFFTDKKLKKAIEFVFRYRHYETPTPASIYGSLRVTGGNSASNFRPMIAKGLFEKYTPEGGTIYDFAAGFGGRLCGALSSKNNYTYIAVEPNTETYTQLNKLGAYFEEYTGRQNSFKIHQIGSEDFRGEAESVDFAFSSPPYFNLENYTEEETQCYIKYPTLDEWLEGYVKATIDNIYHMLKPGCYYAVNIADFKNGSKMVKFVDEWLRLSEEAGFEFVEKINMHIVQRPGLKNGKPNKKEGKKEDKKEGIFVFKKGVKGD